MKVTQAILLLALIGSGTAHADRTTGENLQGTMNCQAALDGSTADKKAATNKVVKAVYAENTAPAARVQSTKSTSGR
jgi:hypothetical protein